MSAPGWIHGPTVDKKTRELRYVSSSAAQLADMTTDKGCLRKWYYGYVEGKKEPQTWQQKEGEDDHANVERYLISGNRIFRPRVAKGIHMLPPPGPHLQVEADMVPTLYKCSEPHGDGRLLGQGEHLDTCKKVSGLHLAPLTAAGIPFVGRIDLMHDLCINYGADNPENARDPDGTIEIFDHKFVKNMNYALSGPDMLKSIQMVAYGEFAFRTIPGLQRTRLSHGYYPTIGNAQKRTILTTREPISRYWSEHVEPLVRSMADAAKEPTADTVPANIKACKAFNRVCMHAEYCNAGASVGLAAHVGQTAAAGLLKVLKNKDSNDMPLIPGKGLLAAISKPSDNAAREAELAKLKAEEAAAKKKALPATLPDTLAKITLISMANNLGTPAVVGKAADALEMLGAAKQAPSGALEGVEIDTVEKFETLLAELVESFGEPEVTATASTAPTGLIPDDAPPAAAAPAEAPMAEIAKEADKPKKTRSKKAETKVIDTTATEVKHEAPAPAPPRRSKRPSRSRSLTRHPRALPSPAKGPSTSWWTSRSREPSSPISA